MTTESMMGKPKNKTKDENPYPKPVLPAELPARLKIIQKYKRGPDNIIVPEEHVTITYQHAGKGKGGSFKVPRAVLKTFWNAMQ